MSLPSIFAGLGVATNLLGAFGAASKQHQLEMQRQAILANVSANDDQQYQNLRSNNMLAMRQNTGLLGDALQSQGRSLGNAAANAGVYNSTGVSGALEGQAAANAAALARASQQNFQSEQGLLTQNQQHLTDLKLGYNNQDLGAAHQAVGASFGGLGSSIQNLIGLLSPRNNGPMMNGNQGSSVLMPGQTGVGGPMQGPPQGFQGIQNYNTLWGGR